MLLTCAGSIFVSVMTSSFLLTSAITGNIHHHHEICTKNKQWGCIGFSSGCIDKKDCKMIAAYQTQKESRDVIFKLHGTTEIDEYISLAISSDDKMGNDGAFFCHSSATIKPGVSVSWNSLYQSQVITSYHMDNFFENPSINYKNGVLECEFTLRRETRIPKPNAAKGVNYDLSQPYFIHLAKGPIEIKTIDNKPTAVLEQHTHRMSTSEKILLNQTNDHDSSADHKSTLVKIHASLMVVAWMFFAEIGTFTAGYFRTRFPEDAGVYWFHIHTITMSVTWVLSVSSVLVMFIGTGFDAFVPERLKRNPHAAVGAAAIIFTFIQPIMGFLRPAPHSKKRRAFNIIHAIVGYLATPLSLIAIMLATTFEEGFLMRQAIFIAGCFVVLWCCGHAFLKAVKRRGLTDGVTIGYFLGIGGFFSFMIAFLIIIFIS